MLQDNGTWLRTLMRPDVELVRTHIDRIEPDGVVTADGNGGAEVQQVMSGSPAASAGLKVNDVITAYNNQPVHTSDDLINDVQVGKVNDQVTLTVQRGGSTQQIKVTLGESK